MKLTDSQRAEVRRRYRPGKAGRPAVYPLSSQTTRALALEFRVSQTTIRRVLADGRQAG